MAAERRKYWGLESMDWDGKGAGGCGRISPWRRRGNTPPKI